MSGSSRRMRIEWATLCAVGRDYNRRRRPRGFSIETAGRLFNSRERDDHEHSKARAQRNGDRGALDRRHGNRVRNRRDVDRLRRRRWRWKLRREREAIVRRHGDQDDLRRHVGRSADRRYGQDRTRRRSRAGARQSGGADGCRAAPHCDLQQLSRDSRHQPEGRLRHAVRTEHRRVGPRHARRRQDRRRRIPRLRRRRYRREERHDDGAGAGVVRQGSRVHRHGAGVGLTRRLRRDRQRRRMGTEARLRGGVHRQGHRHGRARSRDEHRESPERASQRRDGGRQELELHRDVVGERSRGVQRGEPVPRCVQARAFAAKPGEGLGPQHARCRALRALRAERAILGQVRRRHVEAPDQAGQHDRHRLVRVERRRRVHRRRRAGYRGIDRRCRRRGAHARN